LELNAKQLADGSVVYWPKNSDVEFRFETSGPGAMTESVRAIGRPSQPTVAVESPAVSPAAPPTPRPSQTATAVPAPDRPRPNPIGTASRHVFDATELPREKPAPAAAAAIALPDPPAIQPTAPTSSGVAVPALVSTLYRPDATNQPVRVSLEPVPASRRSFPSILKRSVRTDYVPPAALHDPGLLNPPHRSIEGIVNIDVKVYVTPSGKVDYSEVLSKVTESNRDLAALAVFSARRWEFVPARVKDDAVAGEVILHYQFGPGAREGGSGTVATR